MQRLLSIALSCLCAVTLSAQTEYPYPYNPDDNNDGLISIQDLMSLLSIYGEEYSAGVLATDSISAIYYTGELDYWDCTSSCVALTGNWKVLDHFLIGSYKTELQEAPSSAVWQDHMTRVRVEDNPPALYTDSFNQSTTSESNEISCFCQTRTRADIEDINLCEGLEDECGVCNGEGAIYECGCTDIPEGDCDCNGNQLDAVGVCGGDCQEDLDGDGICDYIYNPYSDEGVSVYKNNIPSMISNMSSEIMTIGEAMIYCSELVEFGYEDWVLPTFTQLSFCASGGCVINDERYDADIFSRPNPFSSSTSWIIPTLNLNNGYMSFTQNNAEKYCRCVR